MSLFDDYCEWEFYSAMSALIIIFIAWLISIPLRYLLIIGGFVTFLIWVIYKSYFEKDD